VALPSDMRHLARIHRRAAQARAACATGSRGGGQAEASGSSDITQALAHQAKLTWW
jgi:hypothetical protein